MEQFGISSLERFCTSVAGHFGTFASSQSCKTVLEHSCILALGQSGNSAWVRYDIVGEARFDIASSSWSHIFGEEPFDIVAQEPCEAPVCILDVEHSRTFGSAWFDIAAWGHSGILVVEHSYTLVEGSSSGSLSTSDEEHSRISGS